jgi:hypothetical protein
MDNVGIFSGLGAFFQAHAAGTYFYRFTVKPFKTIFTNYFKKAFNTYYYKVLCDTYVFLLSTSIFLFYRGQITIPPPLYCPKHLQEHILI